ncbi:putative porin [Plasticicumulans lactativorans]|uniref:Putative porin n=1 Tax=Plasticicumulans lactativorans TaxID=1133106 RepID=A0A4R2LJF9_9GAMM|nr:porin [Plasticicumulans lactativorans]TCO83356.1 putative porin [Plasticicumulans lactativorans]
MKNLLNTLALGGALCAAGTAAADTTLYGSIRLGVNYTHNRSADTRFWDVRNDASRFGVRGDEALGGGLSAVYQYEFGVNADGTGSGSPFNERTSWVGLKGGFGTLTLGNQLSPYYLTVGLAERWRSDGFALGYYYLGVPHRITDSLMYTSPEWKGFTGYLAVVANGSGPGSALLRNAPMAAWAGVGPGVRIDTEDKSGIDLYDLALAYRNGGLTLGAAYRDDYAGGFSVWGLAASYETGPVSLTGAWHQADVARIGADDTRPSVLELVAEYSIGATTLRAGWSRFDLDEVEIRDDSRHDTWRVGVQHNLSKRTRLYLEYGDNAFAQIGGPILGNGVGLTDEYTNLALGIRHDF